MTNLFSITAGACETRIEALRSAFGAIAAARIVEAEAADFLWEMRVRERYLGRHIDVGLGCDDGETELSRIAVLTRLEGRWHAAACLVDGEGRAAGLLWRQAFDERPDAEAAFERRD